MIYDVLVIGAGIQGVGVAQALAAAGYSVLVVEQTAPAAGTSSKSSKLIHGGLRYLESFQLGLVRESLQERKLLLELAPDLVKLKQLHIPVYSQTTRSALTIRAGLQLYRALSKFDQDTRFKTLPKSEWGNLGGLKTEGLKTVFRYAEAQTDDAALTRAVLQSATDLGAEVKLGVKFVGAEVSDKGVRVDLRSPLNDLSVDCRVLVNCAGAWVENIISGIQPRPPLPRVELIQGSHLLLPPVIDHYFYLEAPSDRRAIFVLPYQGQLMVGTTEKLHQGAPETAACSQEERHYLLSTLNYYFPHLLYHQDQIESFAGLRVLPKNNQNAFSRSRDVMMSCDNDASPRVVSVVGGKLTTYRATAEQVLTKIRPSLPGATVRGDTRKIKLTPVT
jgi:glycerol-3-phosphate dehydrogenase